MTIDNLKSNHIPTWCPGCNDYLMFAGLDQAIKSLNIPKEKVVIVYDIGCLGNMADFFKTYAIHGLHGRCVPTAVGIKLANPELTVIAVGGDGGIYGEGLNHLLSYVRSPVDITVLVSNNHLYSLTTGQASPTTPKGSKTKSTPLGTVNLPIDPVTLLKAADPNADVVTIDGSNPLEVAEAFKKALVTPLLSVIDVRQVCVTFGKQLLS